MNLYRAKAEVDQFGVVEHKRSEVSDTNHDTIGTNHDTIGTNHDTNRDTILNLISANPRIKQKGIQAKTGLSLRTVKRIMSTLQQDGKIERKGNNRSGEWIIKE